MGGVWVQDGCVWMGNTGWALRRSVFSAASREGYIGMITSVKWRFSVLRTSWMPLRGTFGLRKWSFPYSVFSRTRQGSVTVSQ